MGTGLCADESGSAERVTVGGAAPGEGPELSSAGAEIMGPARHRANSQEVQAGARMAGFSAHSLPTCGSRRVAAACRTRARHRSFLACARFGEIEPVGSAQ